MIGRLIIPLALIPVFIAWFFYHLLVKKDIKQQRNNVYLGLIFIAIWAVIYWLLFKD